MGAFTKLKEVLEDKESFLLVCHIDPDGDAIGSMLALSEVLEEKGKKVSMLCGDKAPEMLSYLSGFEKITSTWPDQKMDAIILLDNGDSRRTGFIEEIKESKKMIPVINIDHHPKNDLWKHVSVNYADEKASSTSEIIYKILEGLKLEINPRVATALLTGIFYDTGGFRHSNTTEGVLAISSALLCKGAKLRKISDHIANLRPVSVFKLWGIALNRLKFKEDLALSYSILFQKDLDECGATEDDISGLVNLLNSAPEAKAALLLYETKDGKIKGSLRTESDDVDISILAKYLGGGGHKKAAGFMIEGNVIQDGDGWKII